MEPAMESSLPTEPLTKLLSQIVTSLDALVRGRRVDLTSLHTTACDLLSRSFDVKESACAACDLDSIIAQG